MCLLMSLNLGPTMSHFLFETEPNNEWEKYCSCTGFQDRPHLLPGHCLKDLQDSAHPSNQWNHLESNEFSHPCGTQAVCRLSCNTFLLFVIFRRPHQEQYMLIVPFNLSCCTNEPCERRHKCSTDVYLPCFNNLHSFRHNLPITA